MFREEIKKIPMDRKALRSFGLLMACVLLLVGAGSGGNRRRHGLGGSLSGVAAPSALPPCSPEADLQGLDDPRPDHGLGHDEGRPDAGLLPRADTDRILGGPSGAVLANEIKALRRDSSYWSGGPGLREKSDYERQF